MGLTSESLRPSSQRTEKDPEDSYIGSVIGPGRSVGPQGVFTSIEPLMEMVRDNVENGATVVVAKIGKDQA